MLDRQTCIELIHFSPGVAALATLIDVDGSAPLPLGSQMLIGPKGTVAGAISGGCVEASILAEVDDVLTSGKPIRRRYGTESAHGWDVGLMCGGSIEVLIQPVSTNVIGTYERIVAQESQPFVWGVHTSGSAAGEMFLWDGNRTDSGSVNEEIGTECLRLLDTHPDSHARHISVGTSGEPTEGHDQVFLCPEGSRGTLIVIGAIDFAGALVTAANSLQYDCHVVDPRETFATKRRFPTATTIAVDWPHRWLTNALANGEVSKNWAICVLTHDPRFDTDSLALSLASEAGYVGALGSRRTHLDRLDRLRAAGVTEAQLDRLHSPIGLDIGGSTPMETAISILAQIIASKSGRSGGPLSQQTSPIH